jgi:hypothetical protein
MDLNLMKLIFHPSLTDEIWFSKPIQYQILTIGAEFGRAKSLLKKGNYTEVKNSLERILELLDVTKSDPKWRYRLKELTRFREWTSEFYINQIDNPEICDHLYGFLLKWHPSVEGVEV